MFKRYSIWAAGFSLLELTYFNKVFARVLIIFNKNITYQPGLLLNKLPHRFGFVSGNCKNTSMLGLPKSCTFLTCIYCESQGSVTPRYPKILHDFVTSLPYWEMEPANELVSPNEETLEGKPYRMNFCSAKVGEVYLIFLLNGGPLTVNLAHGTTYTMTHPRTGNQWNVHRARRKV